MKLAANLSMLYTEVDVMDRFKKAADAGFTHVTARPIDSAPKGADPDEVVTVDPAEGERAALEEDVVVRYVAKAAGRATRGPTAGRAPATKDSPTTGKTGDEESGASSPAKIPTRSGSPGDETSASGPTATETSAPNETGTASSSPAASGDPSGQESGHGNPGGGEGGILVPSDIPVGDEIPPGGAGVPAAHERIDH